MPPNFFGQHTRIYYTSITATRCSRLVPPQNLTASYATGMYVLVCMHYNTLRFTLMQNSLLIPSADCTLYHTSHVHGE